MLLAARTPSTRACRGRYSLHARPRYLRVRYLPARVRACVRVSVCGGVMPCASAVCGCIRFDVGKYHVATDAAGTIVGGAGVTPRQQQGGGGGTWELTAVTVAGDFRGRGIATQLVGQALEDARAAGAKKVIAVTLLEIMAPAWHLYEVAQPRPNIFARAHLFAFASKLTPCLPLICSDWDSGGSRRGR